MWRIISVRCSIGASLGAKIRCMVSLTLKDVVRWPLDTGRADCEVVQYVNLNKLNRQSPVPSPPVRRSIA